MTPLIEKALAAATEQLKEVDQLIETMRPPLVSPGRLQCALFLTIAEQFESVVRLANAGLITHSAILVRSMLEAAADLRLLGTEAEYVERMRYNRASGEKRFYEQLLASERLPDDVREWIDLRQPALLDHHAPLHEQFRRSKRTQADTFVAADMTYVVGYYTMLCSFAHNDITALAFRHQGIGSMTYKAAIPDEISFVIVQLASTALMLATEQMRGIAKFADDQFESRFNSMNAAFATLLRLRPAGADGPPY